MHMASWGWGTQSHKRRNLEKFSEHRASLMKILKMQFLCFHLVIIPPPPWLTDVIYHVTKSANTLTFKTSSCWLKHNDGFRNGICIFTKLYHATSELDLQKTRRGWGLGITRKGNLSHYYFYIAGLLRDQNQPVDQVTAAALLKYGKKCTWPMCHFGPILRKRAHYTFSPTEQSKFELY